MKRQRIRWKFLAIALPIVVLVGWALDFTIPVYSISPGNALNVSPLISVNGTSFHQPSGAIYMTDVSLAQVTPFEWLADHLNSSVALEPASAVVGTASQAVFSRSQLSQMSDAKVAAAVAALNYLHENVPTKYGAEILSVLAGTPADHTLEVGDLVFAVDGVQTPSASSFSETIQSYAPQTTVTLSVLRQEDSSKGVKTATVSVPVTLAKNPKDASKAFLGVEFTQGVYYVLPISVKIRTGEIGGPSAGLAFALGLVERLSSTNITHGLRVAATGTINSLGSVGDVGGVAQKAIAVRDAGAQVFFVPPPEYRVAKAHAGTKMKVFAVSSLSQAISTLNKLAGS